jgi:hypothetical protein
MDAGTPLDFNLQGTRGAYAACAANAESWQAVSVECPSCQTRYIAAVARRDADHDAVQVQNYPDVAGQMLLARRNLADECPDHGYRMRVRAFVIVA